MSLTACKCLEPTPEPLFKCPIGTAFHYEGNATQARDLGNRLINECHCTNVYPTGTTAGWLIHAECPDGTNNTERMEHEEN